MLIYRNIGKVLRGEAKPFQVYTATILGAMIGFAPPFAHGPLWIIALVLLLAIINANIFLATLTAGLAKLLSYLLIPVSFELGILLVDGPLQGIFTQLINAPVIALMGLDYYVTSGGAVLAIVIGVVWGSVIIRGLRIFRTRMAKIENESEKYANWATKKWVRVLCWVFFGGKAKLSYAELLEQRKVGNPIRIVGVVFAILVVGLLFFVQQFASSSIITWYAKDGLERFNGATVDVEGVNLDLAGGKLTIDRLAMADPKNLGQDIFRAQELTADISASDLLRKRMTIDLVLVDDATSGESRETPGELIGKPPEEPEIPGEGKSIEEWFEQAQAWKEKLETFRDLLEKMKGPPKPEDDTSIRGRARERAERYGYANVRARHLVQSSPTVLIKEVRINKLRATWPKDETLIIVATNLSTQPWLATDRPVIDAISSGRTLADGSTTEPTFIGNIAIAPRAWQDVATTLTIKLQNQSVDQTLTSLSLGSQTNFSGGTWMAGLDGTWTDQGLDMPMLLDIRGSQLAWPGIQPTTIDSLPIMFGVSGSLSSPKLDLNEQQFVQTLRDKAGNAIVQQYLQLGDERLQNELNKALGEEGGDQVKDLLNRFRGGSKDDANDNEETEAGGGIGDGKLLQEGLRRFGRPARENDEPKE